MRADFVNRSVQIVSKSAGDFVADRFFALAISRQQNSQRRRLRSFDPLRVVVGDLGSSFGVQQHILYRIVRKPDRGDPHGRSIAVAVVRLVIPGPHPLSESPSICQMVISLGIFFYRAGKIEVVQNGVGNRNRQNSVVGESRDDQVEIFVLDGIALIWGTDHVPGDGADHKILQNLMESYVFQWSR